MLQRRLLLLLALGAAGALAASSACDFCVAWAPRVAAALPVPWGAVSFAVLLLISLFVANYYGDSLSLSLSFSLARALSPAARGGRAAAGVRARGPCRALLRRGTLLLSYCSVAWFRTEGDDRATRGRAACAESGVLRFFG
jgi:hypothetical protein